MVRSLQFWRSIGGVIARQGKEVLVFGGDFHSLPLTASAILFPHVSCFEIDGSDVFVFTVALVAFRRHVSR